MLMTLQYIHEDLMCFYSDAITLLRPASLSRMLIQSTYLVSDVITNEAET